MTAVTLCDQTTTTLVAATPPTVTLVAPVKFAPVIVIGVPPAVEPVVGDIDEIVGWVTYVNASAALAVPFGVVTITFFAPTVPAGVTAVTLVDETTTTLVAATPSTVTLVTFVKLVPVIVIAVPPAVEPDVGDTDEIVVGGVIYVNASAALAVPLGVVTATLCAPTVPAGVTAVTLVDETTTTLVAATPPTVTLVALVKFAPVIVIGAPPKELL